MPGQAAARSVDRTGKRINWVAEPADQRSDGTNRGPLFILVLVAAIVAGLWYWQTRTDTAPPSDQPVATDSASGTATGTADADTAGTGAPDTASTADVLQPTDDDTAAPPDAARTTDTDLAAQTDKVETAGSGTTVPMDTAQTPDPGTADREEQSVTADSATAVPSDSAQATDPGTADREELVVTTDSATAVPSDSAQATGHGTVDREEQVVTADSAAAIPSDSVPTTDPGTVDREEQVVTADTTTAASSDSTQATAPATAGREKRTVTAGPATAGGTDLARTADSGTAAAPGTVRTAETDTAAPTGTGQATDADTTGAELQTAAADPAAHDAGEQLTLAPAPEGTIERVPLDAPPGAVTIGEAGILAAVDRVIEKLEAIVSERIDTEPDADPDTKLRVHVTYDDSEEAADEAVTGTKEADQTADADTAQPTAADHTADSGTAQPTGADQAVDAGTGQLADAGRTGGAGATPPPGDFPPPDTEIAATEDVTRPPESEPAVPLEDTRLAAADSTETEAGEYVEKLTDAAPPTIPVDEEPTLAPTPDGTIERVPLDAPSGTDMIGETGILAAVERVIDELETIVQERLESDTKLRFQVTYDDSEEAADEAVTGTKEADQTADAGTAQPTAADHTADAGTAQPTGADQAVDAGTGQLADAGRTGDAGATPPPGDLPPPDTEIAATEDVTRPPESEPAAPLEDTRLAAADSTETEAREYVEKLTDAAPPTIPVDKADHFVTQEHVISLVPEDTIERVSIDELVKDETLGADTPITIVREVEQTETAVPEKLIAESGGDLDTKLQVVVRYDDTVGDTEEQDVAKVEVPEQRVADQDVAKLDIPERDTTDQDVAKLDVPEQDTAEQDAEKLEVPEQEIPHQDVAAQDQARPESTGQVAHRGDTVEQTTVREVLERIRTEPSTPITLVRRVRFFEVMTLRELLDTGIATESFLDVVRQPYRVEAATLADLLQRKKAENPDTIFYLHTVQPTDEQGIWGIVQFGLIDNFARGVPVRRGEEVKTYTAEIPRDADERLADRSSSFLGLMIDRKTKDSYVYNYRDNRMGRNPDHIHPGQEIVIINFEPEELEAIYEHFASG